MGLTVGRWCVPCHRRLDLATVEQGLREVTGLRVDRVHGGNTLRLPMIREELFDWVFHACEVTVYGFTPAHPFLWENLDAVMTTAGGECSAAPHVWKPDPAHARLRSKWASLSRRDRFVLTLPSIIGARPFDRLLDL